MAIDCETADGSARAVEAKDLCEPMTRGYTPPGQYRIGMELEYFLVERADFSVVSYWSPHGVRSVLLEFTRRFGWDPIFEGRNIIALTHGGAKVSVEPGGAIEYASPPVDSVHALLEGASRFYEDLDSVIRPWGLGLLAMGYHPTETTDSVGLVPKSRYDIMYAYMPRVGTHGRNMMKLTASTQVAIDFRDEADAMRKLRLATQCAPLFLALGANSSLVEGVHSGMECYRAHVWRNTDAARAGLRSFVFRRDATFNDYAAWGLETPVYFLERGDRKHSLVDQPISFAQLMESGGTGLSVPDPRPTVRDWQTHLSTLFPWVRLRNYVEIRCFDVDTPKVSGAAAALVRGLFYGPACMDALEELVGTFDFEATSQLTEAVARRGLSARAGRLCVRGICRDLLAIASHGLARLGGGEQSYLDPYLTKLDGGTPSRRRPQLSRSLLEH